MSNQSSQGLSSEKRVAKKHLRESRSQTEENIIPNGGHCCEVASKLEEMNSKIDKVLSLFTEIEAVIKLVDQLEETNKKLEEAANSTNVEILNLKSTTVYSSITVDKVTKEFYSFEEKVLKLKRQNIKLEAYTIRENLKLFNIEEKEDENVDTEEIVRKTLVEKMSIPEEDVKEFVLNMCIECILGRFLSDRDR